MSITFHEKLKTTVISSNEEHPCIKLDVNVCRLNDGNLIATWTAGGTEEPVTENSTYYSFSSDNGQSWSKKQVLFQHPKKGMFTPEIFTFKDKLFAFPGSYYNDTMFSNDFHSYISISSDNGKTFSPPASIGNAIDGIHVKSTFIKGDRIVLACSWIEQSEESWANFDGANRECILAGKVMPRENFRGLYHQEYCGALVSDNGGESWRVCGRIGYKTGCFVEPALVQLSDGTLVMLIRNQHKFRLYESRSYDLGETWSEIKETDIPSAVTKISLAKDKKGRIYLLNNPRNEGVRSPLSVWISDDDMKTWKTKIDLVWSDDHPVSYPDAFIDDERNMLCFGWDDRKNIYYSEFPLQ